MQYFPLYVDTVNLNVLFVGAGEVVSRKLALLARTQANIHVIAPDITTEVAHYAALRRIKLAERTVVDADIQAYDLVYLATPDHTLNEHLATLAATRGIWVHTLGQPEYCRFITPTMMERGLLTVAMNAIGHVPVLTRILRARLEAEFPPSLEPLLDFVVSRHSEVQLQFDTPQAQSAFWERFFHANALRFDDNTLRHYQNAYHNISSSGEILLLDEQTPARLLPLAAMPLLQRLDWIYSQTELNAELLAVVNHDIGRVMLPALSQISQHYQQGRHMLLVVSCQKLAALKAHFPMAKHLRAGAI